MIMQVRFNVFHDQTIYKNINRQNTQLTHARKSTLGMHKNWSLIMNF